MCFPTQMGNDSNTWNHSSEIQWRGRAMCYLYKIADTLKKVKSLTHVRENIKWNSIFLLHFHEQKVGEQWKQSVFSLVQRMHTATLIPEKRQI